MPSVSDLKSQPFIRIARPDTAGGSCPLDGYRKKKNQTLIMTELSHFFGFSDDLRLFWSNTVIDGILGGTDGFNCC